LFAVLVESLQIVIHQKTISIFFEFDDSSSFFIPFHSIIISKMNMEKIENNLNIIVGI